MDGFRKTTHGQRKEGSREKRVKKFWVKKENCKVDKLLDESIN
jgi:hypothetical protein